MGTLSTTYHTSKNVAKTIVKRLIGFLPPPRSRVTGLLARDGGKPVRDVRFRPWPEYPKRSGQDWFLNVLPKLQHVYFSGNEGTPQVLSREFAKRWADYCGVEYALLVPHGTDALRLAVGAGLDTDGLEYGGEVIVPNFSFVASATAVLDRRCGVALVDVSPDTWTLDPVRVEEAIIPGRTRAIMAVHLFGQPADMNALRDIADRHDLLLIEDAAQAHGALHVSGRAGSLGDVAAFSFQSSKNLSAGEGGVLTTHDDGIFTRAMEMYNAGRSCHAAERWQHVRLGWNMRPNEYMAALLMSRVDALEEEQELRYQNFLALNEALSSVTCVVTPSVAPYVVRHGSHMYVFRYRAEECGGLSVSNFIDALEGEGVPVALAYQSTISDQPAFAELAQKSPNYVRILETPVANQAAGDLLYLPHSVLLGRPHDMREIAMAMKKVQDHYGPRSCPPGGPIISSSKRAEFSANLSRTAFTPETCCIRTEPLRIGLVGAGTMGNMHAKVLAETTGYELAGIVDIDHERAERFAQNYRCRVFEQVPQMLTDSHIDILLIATPHWLHGEFTTAGLEAGKHVICEKPITVTVSEADRVLQTASNCDRLFAVVHETRTQPAHIYVKSLLRQRELGDIHRVSLTDTTWRSQHYFSSSPWRGTWSGEGGGVLLNQAPHALDRYIWLFGMPQSVRARCSTLIHDIEVEDMASAVFFHANGMHGVIHFDTLQSPGRNDIEIVCDRGTVVVESQYKVRVTKLDGSILDLTTRESRSMPDVAHRTYERVFPRLDMEGMLHEFYKNFAEAVRNGVPLLAPGIEGLGSVELANAMILSSEVGSEVVLPVGRKRYDQFIEGKCGSPRPDR